tara:strand:+ start:36982 stop:40947 length:3966 start_codon:yes stop_codon:yes gene_type:complete
MIQSSKYTYNGINQDMSRSKHDPSLYFEGQHIRLISEDSQTTGSITNEKGTKEVFSIPNDININTTTKQITYTSNSIVNTINYTNTEIDSLTVTNDHKIIGHTVTKDSIILITTSNGLDCTWEVKNIYNNDNVYSVDLLYLRDIGLSISNPIQLIYNYENEKNEKIYWVDGKAQLRFLNLRHSIENGDIENLIDLDSDLINTVGNIQVSQPEVTGFSQGGSHTTGVIQYSYNLYKTNLSQSVLSPLSPLVPLSSNLNSGGGDVNEIVGSTPIVQIDNIDLSYTNIIIYAIKYTSLNEVPKISIISDRAIPSNGSITVYDDGSTISDISLEQLVFLGSEAVVPKHIESKDNQLFKFNVTEDFYDLKDIDTRAYSFNTLSASSLWSSTGNIINDRPASPFIQVPASYIIPKTFDSINPDYNIYKYQNDGTTLGGEGKYLKYELSTTNQYSDSDQYLKSNEIHRISIEFYNAKGQKSLPKWIADFIAPDNNLNGLYNTLTVELKADFYTYINSLSVDQRPIGYQILRANRTVADRTIICQGVINPMIANKVFKDKHLYSFIQANPNTLYDQQIVKYPSLIRTFEDNIPLLKAVDGLPLANSSTTSNTLGRGGSFEGFKAEASGDWRGQLFQFNTMMQMYTPEVIFSNVRPDRTHKLKVKGILEQSDQQAWNNEINFNTQLINHAGKFENGINPANPNSITTTLIGNPAIPTSGGIFAPSGDGTTANLHQFYREFKGTYEQGLGLEYNVYGTPEVQVLGQGVRSYNNDSSFRYSNNYSTILQDQKGDNPGGNRPTGRGYNSNSISAVTFVEGSDDPNTIRRTIEQIHQENNLSVTNGILISEFVKPDAFKYTGNLYGGNNYESKLRTNYIPIGSYADINDSITVIKSPGDTFVHDFTFTKASKTGVTIASPGVNQLTEIVSFKVETSVDLKNRNDNSDQDWDSENQPNYDSFQKYNTVYSQKENILKRRNVDANFKEINEFGTTIRATKKKIAGEVIDSWTDDLVNETMDLDGKYGSINGTINFKDQIYTFQDKAVCAISINPRVQTQASDGLSLELGTGRVLQDYQYVTTKSGSINKWGIVGGAKGIYYYDTLNKSLFRVNDSTEMSLSDLKGLRSWFHNNADYTSFKQDNPLLNNGVLLGYDTYNKDVYITLQGNVNKTRVFNEKLDQFVDTKLYIPNSYIDSSHKFFGTNNNLDVHKFNEGIYNEYFGVNHPSFVTLMINPAADLDCVFNNIIYKSEVYLNGVDLSDQTLTYIRAYNEHQDSGIVPFVNRQNIARKFRDWKALIPREGRDRMRNPWLFLELGFENPDGKKLVLHDTNVLYTI